MLQPNTAYLRQPTLHGETVVFVSDDDLWRVGADGGEAVRLSAGLSEPATPCLSPDGLLHPSFEIRPCCSKKCCPVRAQGLCNERCG